MRRRGMWLVALTATGAAQTPQPRKFMGGPVTIEDQGSFFIGGVQEIADLMIDWVSKNVRAASKRR
jgi:hypothetical protein